MFICGVYMAGPGVIARIKAGVTSFKDPSAVEREKRVKEAEKLQVIPAKKIATSAEFLKAASVTIDVIDQVLRTNPSFNDDLLGSQNKRTFLEALKDPKSKESKLFANSFIALA